MRNEIRSATTLDIEKIRAYVDELRTNAVIDIAFVSDANHDDSDRNDLSVGYIRGHSLKFVGKSETSGITYKPIDSNIRKYPVPGEFVLVTRTSHGNFYITTLNFTDNVNNNIDTDKVKGYVKLLDDSNTNKNEIRNSKQLGVDKNISDSFEIKRIGKSDLNYGDITLDGRFGNKISLSHSENKNPVIYLENSGSFTSYYNDKAIFPKILDTDYYVDVESVYNIEGGSHIVTESERIVNRSTKNGYFVESKNGIGISTDTITSINSGQITDINGEIVLLGGEEALNPLVKGVEFARQWTALIGGLHEFLSILKSDGSNPLVSQSANYFKGLLNQKIASTKIVEEDSLTPGEPKKKKEYLNSGESLSKFLSDKVYTK